ncbi:hypothetical protein CISIN_1g042509mg [Citrus sinensis]|uniref:Uncharacterized protein n=1 Tax=Citrus sinensis TaxID=2711 RepID=A0A067F0H3_CITSI|nr:hypothetical protein CISIN_1g042509mg [Citrus sinensis]
MVDAIVSAVLERLISTTVGEAEEQVRLVVGVEQDVEKLKRNFRAIQAVLVDAEQKQVKEETVRLWLDQLKDASYDMEDVLDEWITARLKLQIEGAPHQRKKKVCSFIPASCFGVQQVFVRRDIALKIKAINERLDEIAEQKGMFNFNMNVIKSIETPGRVQSVSFIDEDRVCGRDDEKNKLIRKLLSESSEEQKAVQTISVVGMGGIGKTTLAQMAYNDPDVRNHFKIRMWVCVSDPFDEFSVAKSIIEGLEGETSNLGSLQSYLLRIYEAIAKKKFLLVLDDVWNDDRTKWEPLNHCLMNGQCGSKILVTTRKETVSRMMESTNVMFIEELSESECWRLFQQLAFFGRSPSECENLEEIGRKIVHKCKGLPLAAKTIGSLLCFKRTEEEWQSILDSELWKVEEFENDLFGPLLMSFNDLPSRIKRCFTFCAVFPKDWDIKKDELIKLWMAQGYITPKENKEMEIIGDEYFDYLATRSFFQDFVKHGVNTVRKCKMHDVIHDFAQFLSKNERFSIGVDDPEESTSMEKLRHFMLVLGKSVAFPVSIFKARKLRSLLIVGPICEIPKEIENFMYLRFLKLSKAEIVELPETCCELFNLQTLEMEDCCNLKRLPQEIGKLVNLRYLIYNDSYLHYLPRGIERLTCLRTLSEFVVSRSGGKYGSKASNLEGLRHLNHLRGFLAIVGLGNVKDVDEAKNAELEKKKNLFRLELWFNNKEEEEEEESMEENQANQGAISEALRPPPNLESLEIWEYKGKAVFENWIVSLNKLKKLFLINCYNCEIMPPLGKLPFLESLKIRNMNVKKVGDEFLGIKSNHSSGPAIAFPKLKHLKFMKLSEWEEWDFGITRSGKEEITIMPQLNSLEIILCAKLKSLPNQLLQRTKLNLNISLCPTLF